MVLAHFNGQIMVLDGEVVPLFLADFGLVPRKEGEITKRESITSVTFPSDRKIQHIGYEAFRGCNLTSVTLPEGLKSIEESAFHGCPLTSVTFPEGLRDIGSDAFRDCPLTSVTFNAGLKRIGYEAFRGCPLTSVTFPEGLESIGVNAFRDCPLTSVTFPPQGGLKYIGDDAFRGCLLTSVTFPESLQSIEARAFSRCPLLNSVFLPHHKQIEIHDGKAFDWFSGQEDLIGTNCRASALSYYIQSMIPLTFPEGQQSIGAHAFSRCPLLNSVILPDSKQMKIHRKAFNGCTKLEDLSAASGRSSVLSYVRFQPTVRRRVAVLLCLKRLLLEYNGDAYVEVSSAGTTPAGGALEGKLAFQIITSDDLWRHVLEFLGPENDDENDGGNDDDDKDDKDDDDNVDDHHVDENDEDYYGNGEEEYDYGEEYDYEDEENEEDDAEIMDQQWQEENDEEGDYGDANDEEEDRKDEEEEDVKDDDEEAGRQEKKNTIAAGSI